MLMEEDKRCEKRIGKRKMMKEDIIQPTPSDKEWDAKLVAQWSQKDAAEKLQDSCLKAAKKLQRSRLHASSSRNTGKEISEVVNSGGEKLIFTSCQPLDFCITVDNFTAVQKEAVRDMGFGSLLAIGYRKIRRSLCCYIVQHFDPEKPSVEMHGKKLEIDPVDFSYVMGLQDHDFWLKEKRIKVEMKGSLHDACMKNLFVAFVTIDDDGKEKIYFSKLIHIFSTHQDADDIFKVAFVLYTIGVLLCPSLSLYYMPASYLLPLRHTGDIRLLNWADYSFNYLVEGIRAFKSGNRKGIGNSRPRIIGCMLFLQLFYCDAIAVGRRYRDFSIPPICTLSDDVVEPLIIYVKAHGGYASKDIKIVMNRDNQDLPMDAKMRSSDEVYVDEIKALRGEIKVMNENMEKVIEALVNLKEDVTKDVMDNVGKKLGLCRDTTNINKWSDDNELPLNKSLLDTYSAPKYKGMEECSSGKKILLNKVINISSLDTSNLPSGERLDSSCKQISGSKVPMRVYNRRTHRRATNSKDSTESVRSPINTRASHQRKVGQQLCSPYIAMEVGRKRQLKFDDARKTVVLCGPSVGCDISLTDVEAKIMNYIFREDFDDSLEVIRHSDGEYMTRFGLKGIGPYGYLSNQLLHSAICNLRDDESRSWFLSPYFAAKVLSLPEDADKTFFETTKFTGQIWGFKESCKQSDCEKVFVPINDVDGEHWFLAVILMVEKTIEIWDSFPVRMKEREAMVLRIMNAIQHILTHEIDVKGFSIHGTKIPNFTLSTPLKVPKQPNTTDCGLFVIKFMEEYRSVFADYDESKWDSIKERCKLMFRLMMHPKNLLLPHMLAANNIGSVCVEEEHVDIAFGSSGH